MKIQGNYSGASRDLQGNLILHFAVDGDAEMIRKLEGFDQKDLDIDIDEHKNKRSLNANAYFWKLCDQIAKKIGSDKDSIYKLQLSRYGVFVDVQVWKEAIEEFRRQFRYIEELDDGYGETRIIRCYIGSSYYDTKEMHDLIAGTCRDAEDLGIQVFDQDRIDDLVKNWQGGKYDYLLHT